DPHVELHVVRVHRIPELGVAAARKARKQDVELFRKAAQLVPLGGRRALAEEPRRMRFERFAQFVELIDVFGGVDAHAPAGARAGGGMWTRRSSSRRRSASATGRRLMPSSSAIRRRDNAAPGRSRPRRMSSRTAAYAWSASVFGVGSIWNARLWRSTGGGATLTCQWRPFSGKVAGHAMGARRGRGSRPPVRLHASAPARDRQIARRPHRYRAPPSLRPPPGRVRSGPLPRDARRKGRHSGFPPRPP